MPHSWRQLCTIATILVLVLIVLLNQFGSPLTGYLLERQVVQHLQMQGYSEEHFSDVRVIYNPSDRHTYTAEVIFQDHGGYARYYAYNSEHELQELERIGR